MADTLIEYEPRKITIEHRGLLDWKWTVKGLDYFERSGLTMTQRAALRRARRLTKGTVL
jgi:hypothetical protein